MACTALLSRCFRLPKAHSHLFLFFLAINQQSFTQIINTSSVSETKNLFITSDITLLQLKSQESLNYVLTPGIQQQFKKGANKKVVFIGFSDEVKTSRVNRRAAV